MKKTSILIIEDDESIQELIAYHLEKEGLQIRRISHGSQALLEIGAHPPDLIVLDLMLPGVAGDEICRHLKANEETRHIPVVMVTAKNAEKDIVHGLELGADDYIPKPFSPKVLVARVKALLRRPRSAPEKSDARNRPVKFGDLAIDPRRHEVLLAGRPVELTLTEYKILVFLTQKPGWVFTRPQIVEAVRGDAYNVTDRSVDVIVFGLRKKLGERGDLIETVRGVGYRFRGK
jgi:two-component system alkaline phosphatase synthesis response regulator PhoP